MSEHFDFSKLAGMVDVPDPLARSAPEAPLRELRVAADSTDRSAARRHRWAAFAVSCAWLLAHLVVFGVRGDLRSLPLVYVVLQIALPLLFALVSLALAMRGGKAGLGARVAAMAAVSVLGPLAFWSFATLVPAPRPELPGEDTGARILLCLDLTLIWAAIPLSCAALALRHAFPVASHWRSALVGAAAGLLASGVMNLHCPNVSRLHIALGHGVPVLIAVLVGAVLMPRVTRA